MQLDGDIKNVTAFFGFNCDATKPHFSIKLIFIIVGELGLERFEAVGPLWRVRPDP
jgi:hypothetical protein